MARLHGKSGAVSISASTSPDGSPADGDLTVLGSLRSWTVSFDRATLDNTSLRTAGKRYLPALTDVRGGFDGVFDTNVIALLMAATVDADAVWLRFTPSTDYPEMFVQGSAWVNVTWSGSVNDAVTVSATFIGNGVWQQSFDA